MHQNRNDASKTATTPASAPASPADLRRAVVLAGHRLDARTARAHLLHDVPAVRAAALGALERAGDLVASDLIEAARDPDPGVRRRVAELAARFGTDAPESPGSPGSPTHTVNRRQSALEEMLLVLLADHDDTVAEVASFALGEAPLEDSGDSAGAAPRRVTALALVTTGHHDPLCREAAVAALGATGHPAGLTAVLTACGDRANVRRRAVLALSAFDGDAVTTMLEQLSTDRDLQVSQAALDLLEIEAGHLT